MRAVEHGGLWRCAHALCVSSFALQATSPKELHVVPGAGHMQVAFGAGASVVVCVPRQRMRTPTAWSWRLQWGADPDGR